MANKNIVLCDTNVIIDLMRGNNSTLHEINAIGKNNIYISAVTMAELLYGALNKRESEKISKYTESIGILPITENITSIFINIVKKYGLSHSIGIPDSIIAATAIHHKIELFTLNIKDFRFIPDLTLYIKK